MMQNKQLIYNSDCIEQMQNLIEKGIQVDAVITDPPYNISKKNNFHTLKGRKGIDFGNWDKDFDQLKWLEYANKLLKPGGNIIIFNGWKNLGKIAKYLENEFKYSTKDIIRWKKNNPMPRNMNRRYVSDYEFAIWAVKPGGKWTFNNIKGSGYLRPEFLHPIAAGKEKTIHPTQKSLSLMEDIIKVHTNENDLVLDPFMGSGTTILGCKNLNRNFIGIELNEEYFAIAKSRIE